MEKGLNIFGKTNKDTNEIYVALDEAGYYLESKDGYVYVPEYEENYDKLEIAIIEILDVKCQALAISYRIEGVF
jgi:hypothetical protein